MATSSPTDLVGRVLTSRYRLMRRLGQGAFAQVYVADDVTLRRRVAIKVLNPALAEERAFLRRFAAEAQAVAGLRHPHILRVYDWGEDEGDPYLVMELLEGGSLRSYLDQGRRLSPAQAARVGADVAGALDYAHRRGLVHRDVKPANLIFDDEARIALADFGLARALAEVTLTEPSGSVLGTARYAAPEALHGEALDGRADVYALALVLAEATTGQVPFALDTSIATLMRRLHQPITVPADLGPLAAVLEAAGTVEPGERLDAATFAARLEEVAGGLPAPEPLVLVGPLAGGEAEADPQPTDVPRPAPAGPAPEEGPGWPAGGSRLAEIGWAAEVLRPAEGGPPAEVAGSGEVSGWPAVPWWAEAGRRTGVSGPATVLGPSAQVGLGAGEGLAAGQAVWEGPASRAGEGVPDGETVEPGEGLGAGGGIPAGEGGWRGVAPATASLGSPPAPSSLWPAPPAPPAPTPATPGPATRTEASAPVVRRLRSVARPRKVARAASQPPPPLPEPPAESGSGEDAARRRRRRRRRKTGVGVVSALAVLVFGGGAAYLATRPAPTYPVPALAGQTIDGAAGLLSRDHLDLVVSGRAYSATTSAGRVLSQRPARGRATGGTRVAVVLSRGPRPVHVPALAGEPLGQARAALAHADLRVATVTKAASMTVPAGSVIGTNPAGGTLLPHSGVSVVVSTGKPTVVVPTLAGANASSYAAAAAALRSAGLTATQSTEYSNDVTKGQVIDITPAAGTTVTIGTAVDVKVSLGPHLAVVPDVYGDSVTTAAERLAADGFAVSAVNGSPLGTVSSTSPAVGQAVLYGSSVTLSTG